MKTVLDVKNLNISFAQDGRIINAVRNVSFTVGKGETVALVGESGSGKSVTALATVALLPDSATVTGSIQYNGAEMVGASEPTLRKVRGNDKLIRYEAQLLQPCADFLGRDDGLGHKMRSGVCRLMAFPHSDYGCWFP